MATKGELQWQTGWWMVTLNNLVISFPKSQIKQWNVVRSNGTQWTVWTTEPESWFRQASLQGKDHFSTITVYQIMFRNPIKLLYEAI